MWKFKTKTITFKQKLSFQNASQNPDELENKPLKQQKKSNYTSFNNSALNVMDLNFEIDIVELIVKQNGFINDEILKLSR